MWNKIQCGVSRLPMSWMCLCMSSVNLGSNTAEAWASLGTILFPISPLYQGSSEISFMLSSIIYLVSAIDYIDVRIHSTLWLHHKLCCDLILCINLQEPPLFCGYVDNMWFITKETNYYCQVCIQLVSFVQVSRLSSVSMDTNLSCSSPLCIYHLLSLIVRYCHVIKLFHVVSAHLLNPVVIWKYWICPWTFV